MAPQLLGLSDLFPLPTVLLSTTSSSTSTFMTFSSPAVPKSRTSTQAPTASHAPEQSPEQSATMAIPTISSQTSPNQSTMISTSSTIQLTANATSSTLISSAIPPTSRNTNSHNRSRTRILPIAVTISALLMGVGLIVLYVHWIRRRKKQREMLVPHVDSHDPTSLTRGHRDYGSDPCETVEPFDTSQSWLAQEISSRYMNTITKSRGSENVAENGSALTAARQGVKESVRGPNSDQIQPSNIGEILMEQNDGLIQRPSRMEDTNPNLNAAQPRSLLVEALQERLRLVEDIALRSVHNSQREDPRNLERELQELIPPPDYTPTLNVPDRRSL